MSLPTTINLTTADRDGSQEATGWLAKSGLYEVVIDGTFGGATVQLQAYSDANAGFVSTGDEFTGDAVPRIEISGRIRHRFYLSVAGSGADIDIALAPVRLYRDA